MVEDENPTALGEDEEHVLDSSELDEEDGKPQKKGTGRGRGHRAVLGLLTILSAALCRGAP